MLLVLALTLAVPGQQAASPDTPRGRPVPGTEIPYTVMLVNEGPEAPPSAGSAIDRVTHRRVFEFTVRVLEDDAAGPVCTVHFDRVSGEFSYPPNTRMPYDSDVPPAGGTAPLDVARWAGGTALAGHTLTIRLDAHWALRGLAGIEGLGAVRAQLDKRHADFGLPDVLRRRTQGSVTEDAVREVLQQVFIGSVRRDLEVGSSWARPAVRVTDLSMGFLNVPVTFRVERRDESNAAAVSGRGRVLLQNEDESTPVEQIDVVSWRAAVQASDGLPRSGSFVAEVTDRHTQPGMVGRVTRVSAQAGRWDAALVRSCLPWLRSDDVNDRARTVEWLRSARHLGAVLLGDLEELAGDEDYVVRETAILAMAAIHGEAITRWAAFVRRTLDEESPVRAQAFLALGQVVAAARNERAGMLRRRGGTEAAAKELEERLEATSADAVTRLVEGLLDEHPNVQMHAAWGLGWMAEAAALGVPALREAAASAEGDVHAGIIWAISRIGADPACVPLLIAALASPHEVVVQNAAWALRGLGRVAEPAVPTLQRLLDDSVARAVRFNAVYALGAIGPAASPARDVLRGIAESTKDAAYLKAVQDALHEIGE
jgi:HEAT repeat protein